MNDATHHTTSAPAELLWERLIRHLRLGYRTIVEDLADLEPRDTEILLGLAVNDERFSFDIYENRAYLEESGAPRFNLPGQYERLTRGERMRLLDRLMQEEVGTLFEKMLQG